MKKKLKIYVYAISKNESKFVNTWVNSMQEADGIYVLDTGSTDDTVNLLKERNVHVTTKKYDTWRFDTARNDSLSLVPIDADICVCTDLDEQFIPGWRKKLENIWQKDTTRLGYNYNWHLDENNKPLVNFYIEKIHARNDYKWTHPVHEVLTYIGKDKENLIFTDEITLNHYPDKTKPRSSYLSLLEMSVKEDPNDDRNMHYLGREYMYYKRYNEAIDTLIKHLNLPNATWKDERAASMRFIARSYKGLNRYDEAILWYQKAIKEAPYLRDSYIELAMTYHELKNYPKVIKCCNQALKIKTKTKSYINEVFSWNETVYDLLSIAYFNTNKLPSSIKAINEALKIKPNDERLLKNKNLIKEKIRASKL